MNDFKGVRSQLYKEALREFPDSRTEDIEIMKKYLSPKSDEVILEVGAGSGFFSGVIADMSKKLIVSDPSNEQLQDVKNLNRKNIETIIAGAETIDLAQESVDAIWSFGAMHHCFNKTDAFKNFQKILKKDGRIIIIDVFNGSVLAKHFDSQVMKYCVTGHEVAFWTDEFAESLCYVTGFEKPRILELDIRWKFKTKEDIGQFLYKIHAMTKTTPEECLRGAEQILGVIEEVGFYKMNWPLKLIETKKL